MKLKHESGIYVCLCTSNNKCYVGQSKDIRLRVQQHKSALKHSNHYNKHLQNAYNKYGKDAFVWYVSEYCSVDKLNEREKYWIEKLDTVDSGFNQTDGGAFNRVYKRNETFKKNLSKTLKSSWDNDPKRHEDASIRMRGRNNPMYGRYGNKNPAFNKDHSGNYNGMYGKHQTEATKELNRQAHLGAKNKNSKAVICIETGELFASMGEAGRQKHCNDTTINKVCRGVKKTAGGYHWRYATEEEKITFNTHIHIA